MAIVDDYAYEPMVGDPDDHRPNTTWALVVDPATPDGRYVRGLTLLFEKVAVGDRIPLHTHSVEEALVIDEGDAEATVGAETRVVRTGAVVFVPPGTAHGMRNVGDRALRLHGVFASPNIPITMLDRNPAPGTEGDDPQPPSVYDARAPQPLLPTRGDTYV
jgi:quercetin dioxygenase-like cupin family protein